MADDPASSDAADRPRRGPIAAIAVGAVAIDSALLGLLAPLLPEIQERTGAGDEAVGLALGAYAIPIALLSLPLGRLADAFGRRTLLTAGLLLVAVGSALVAISESLEALLAARVVQGAGSAASWIAALALVSDTAPPGRRGEALGAALAATGIGSIAGPALGGVAADVFSFETPFIIAGFLALVLLGAALATLPREERRPRSAVPAFPMILKVVRSRPGAWAAAIILASAFVLGLVEVVAPLDLDARLGLSASVIGLLFSASIAVDALFAPIGGRLGDRRGRRLPALSGLALTALSVALLAVLPGVVGTIIALGVYGAGFSFSMAAAIPWLDEAFDEAERGLAYGVQNLLYAGGYALGPIVGGALLGVASADFAYLATAAATAVVALALWGVRGSSRSAAHRGEQHDLAN